MPENIEQKVKDALLLQKLQIEALEEEVIILKHQNVHLLTALKSLDLFEKSKN